MRWDVPVIDKNNLAGVLADLARQATVHRPSIAHSWEMLAHHLLQTGADEEALAVLAEAVAKHPAEPKLHLMLADAHTRVGQFDVARQVLDRAPAVPSADREMTIRRFELLMNTLAAKDAINIATQTLALEPTNTAALTALGQALRDAGRAEEMIPFCKAALERKPGHTCARYELAFALAVLERSDEARHLIDLDQFITVTDVPAPECYATAEAFVAAIAGEILRNPTLKPDPVGKATKGGLHTVRPLPHAGDQVIGLVLDLIRQAVDVFDANLPEGLDHPFVKRRPMQAWLHAWAVVHPGDGLQVAHIHPDGWLSGVFYVSVPKTSSDYPRGGCLVLGSLENNGAHGDPPWGLRDIRPVPGQLVLFPSYVPHATIPTKSVDGRICISFDVVPA
jgi:Flp pilus assembly protein TadD